MWVDTLKKLQKYEGKKVFVELYTYSETHIADADDDAVYDTRVEAETVESLEGILKQVVIAKEELRGSQIDEHHYISNDFVYLQNNQGEHFLVPFSTLQTTEYTPYITRTERHTIIHKIIAEDRSEEIIMHEMPTEDAVIKGLPGSRTVGYERFKSAINITRTPISEDELKNYILLW